MLIKSFQKAEKVLNAIGVKYYTEHDYGKQGTDTRHEFAVPLFTYVKLPFTPLEWCALCMKDGMFYVGGCCATCSAIQDIISHCFRFDSGLISIKKLSEIAELWILHEEDGEIQFGKTPKKTLFKGFKLGVLDPWQKMALIWHVVKDYYRQEIPSGFGDHIREEDKAISLLSTTLSRLSIARMFDNMGESAFVGGNTGQKDTNHLIALSKVVPALKILNKQIKKLAPKDFEGFALMDKLGGPECIAHNSMGLCIYKTREEIDSILDLWGKQENEFEEQAINIDERIGIRKVKITLKNGLEFTD